MQHSNVASVNRRLPRIPILVQAFPVPRRGDLTFANIGARELGNATTVGKEFAQARMGTRDRAFLLLNSLGHFLPLRVEDCWERLRQFQALALGKEAMAFPFGKTRRH